MNTLTDPKHPRKPVTTGAARVLQIVPTARQTGDRLTEMPPVAFGAVPDCQVSFVTLDGDRRSQSTEGFGGGARLEPV